MQLTFYGGTGEATGSNYILESGGTKIMIDCGLHQGSHYADRENFDQFAYDPKTVTAVFITHAHLDHIGRLPSLTIAGFNGTIYSTHATHDFAELMLDDSEHLLAQEAEREARPQLYRGEDIQKVMSLWKGISYHQPIEIGPFKIELYDAGHILGSAIIHIEAEGKTIVFSGDLGNSPAPIIKPTEELPAADYCLIESTYGDRIHEDVGERKELLERAIQDTVVAGGTLIIPTFSLERSQELLFELNDLIESKSIPIMPIFLDSPLAIRLTEIFKQFRSYFNEMAQKAMTHEKHIFDFPGLHETLRSEESKMINSAPNPKVVIAGSGMSSGGRIVHHERHYLPDPNNTLLLTGYQAVGTPGRLIQEGVKTVHITGEDVVVRAHVVTISGYSGLGL